jgi:hypothetical protein
MACAPNYQEQSAADPIYRGEAVSQPFLGVTTTNPAAWSLALTFCLTPGATPELSVTDGFTFGGPDVDGHYTVYAPLTSAQTLALAEGLYYADLWRTDAGSEERLAGYTEEVLTGSYVPGP